MEQGQPSRTAWGAACHRAAHQVLERGLIFTDPLAMRILGTDADVAVREDRKDPSVRKLRLFIAVRTRFAEDALATVIARRGIDQLVVLGAGLDTYAYRTSLGESLRVFEVDHPATQAWKRQLLAEASIPTPRSLDFAPVDFERGTLEEGLTAVGFDPALPTFFTWLGVVPYLTEQAVFSTLGFIASLPGGAHVVFDYTNPPISSSNQGEYAAAHKTLAERVASLGEAFKSAFETDYLYAKLTALGFREIEDLGPAMILERYFAKKRASSHDRGGHVVRASTRNVSERRTHHVSDERSRTRRASVVFLESSHAGRPGQLGAAFHRLLPHGTPLNISRQRRDLAGPHRSGYIPLLIGQQLWRLIWPDSELISLQYPAR